MSEWYLYLPSAFACIGVAVLWVRFAASGAWRSRVVVAALGSFFVGAAAVLVREPDAWREASRIGDRIVAQVTEAVRTSEATKVLVLYPPAAGALPTTVGEQPIFVNGLELAVQAATGKRCTIAAPTLLESPRAAVELRRDEDGALRWTFAGLRFFGSPPSSRPIRGLEILNALSARLENAQRLGFACDVLWFDGESVQRLVR